MDSEQNPAADDIDTILNETFIEPDGIEDEVPPSDSETTSESGEDPDELILDCSGGSSDECQERKSKLERLYLKSARGEPLEKSFRRLNENRIRVPTQRKEKILTQSELKMQEILSQAVQVREEVEHTMFERYEMPEDETLPEVRQLTQRGFISARTVHTLTQKASQSQRASPPKFRQQMLLSRLLPKDADDTDDELDEESFKQILRAEDHHDLKYSLGNLSQVLNTSQKAGQLIEDTVARTRHVDLDATCIDLEMLPSDDEDVFPVNTEAMELDFLIARTQAPEPVVRTPPPSPIEVSYTEDEPIGETEAMESAFLNFQTQVDSFTQKAPNTNLQMSSGIGNTGMFSGFSLSSGKSSRNAWEIKTTGDFNMDPPVNQPVPAFSGFGLASGKTVNIKDSFLSRFERAFLEADKQIEAEVAESKETLKTPVPIRQFKVPLISPSLPSTSLNNTSFISTPESSKPQSRFNLKRQLHNDSFSTFVPLDSPAAPAMGFATAAGTNYKLKTNTLSKISEMFAEEDQRLCKELEESPPDSITPVKPRLKKLRLNFDQSPAAPSPLMQGFQQGINKHSTPLLSRVQKADHSSHSQEVAYASKIMDIYDTEELFPPSQNRKKLSKVRLLYKLNGNDDAGDEGNLLVPSQVKNDRSQALKAQTESIKGKADCEKAQMAGSVFMMKSSRNRLKVRNFVNNEPPQVLNRHDVTYNNALDFKFDMKNFLSEEVCRTNVDGLSLADNARLFMDDNARVGLVEIESAFLASPGVDPGLAGDLWVENTFKMIVLKLAWLENSFSKFKKFEVLSPENLLLQMKYRYDRAIDRHHRSAIHKIVELDDVPCRRMVLKVLDVSENRAVGYELVVSDGWHSIKATIDSGLADAVTRKKITVGTKLITSNAEIIGCEHGFDPLKLPDFARLKIHANSTRRTCWDARLGYCANPGPFRVPLDSVLATGGTIGKLVVVVTHVYQSIYVDSSKEPKEFRSEKLQLRLQDKLDVLSFALYETIAHQVQQEALTGLKERVAIMKQRKSKIGDLCPEEVCDLLDFETDADTSAEMQAMISPRMMRKAQEVREQRLQDMNSEIRARLGQRDKNLAKLLKFRVVDAINPKNTALVSCWVVHDELIDMVREGKVLEIMKATVGLGNKELQVTVSKSSVVRPSKLRIPEGKFKKYFRNETRISDIGQNFRPPQNEFDVACVIVHIEAKGSERPVKVYVADEDTNILCLNFWSSLRESAFDDVVIEGHIVYARNVQWRPSSSSDIIPQAFVTDDTTSFLLHPKQEFQERRLTELGERVGNIDEFLAKCREKVGKGGSINKENNKSMNSTLNQSVGNRSDSSRSFAAKMTPSPASTTLRRRLGMSHSPFNKEIFTPKAPTKKTTRLSGLQRLAFQRR